MSMPQPRFALLVLRLWRTAALGNDGSLEFRRSAKRSRGIRYRLATGRIAGLCINNSMGRHCQPLSLARKAIPESASASEKCDRSKGRWRRFGAADAGKIVPTVCV